MAENTAGTVDVPQSLFGGLNTELSPPDIPEGVSPENQDVRYLPGSVSPRPTLKKQLSGAALNFASLPYIKTFIQPNQDPLTLILDSEGQLSQEDVNHTPGIVTDVSGPSGNQQGAYAQSVTQFGREYIAYSDGKHGLDVPRQYDGINYDRVTQDGPGTPPLAQLIKTTVAIASVAPLLPSQFISSAVENGVMVTITTAAPHGMYANDYVKVATGNATYDNSGNPIRVELVSSSTTFSYTVGITGLPNIAAGSISPLACLVTTQAGSPLFMKLFDQFVIRGCANGSGTYDNNYHFPSGVVSPPTWQVIQKLSEEQYVFQAVDVAAGAIAGSGSLDVGSQVSAGPHRIVLMYQTRNGAITAPSPPVTVQADGFLPINVYDCPIPPANIAATILAFTLSGGDNYFYIPVAAMGTARDGTIQQICTPTFFEGALVSTTLTFSDITLAGAVAIDIPGNNLFAQTVLSPCLGFYAYASRLFAYGEWNNVKNLLNMGFDGGMNFGTVQPTGWTSADAQGSVISGYTEGVYKILSTGGSLDGQILQSAYQDTFGIAILQPKTQYTVRLRATTPAQPNYVGSIVVALISASTGFAASVFFPINSAMTSAEWVQGNLSAVMPAIIPSDLMLNVYVDGANVMQTVTIDELMLIYTEKPYRDTLARGSYVNNPEAFDEVTGDLGSASDTAPIMCFSTLRDFMYLKTSAGFHRTQDGGGEPSTWPVIEVSRRVGAVSFRAGDAGQFGSGDTGEGWDLTFSRSGLYIYAGGELYKISQEVQTIVDQINWNAAHTIWLKNDTVTRRVYIGIPYQEATAPNIVLVMDYREMDTAYNIAQGSPVHISFSGKMISSDLTRKWTIWNTPMNCGELLVRPGNDIQFCMGSGNGEALNVAPAFGNFYALDDHGYTGGGTVTITPLATNLQNAWPQLQPINFPSSVNQDLEWPLNISTERCAFKIALTNLGPGDDDYGPVLPSYTTYFFLNHEAEIALGTGAHMKLFCYLAMYINGDGAVQKLIVSVRQHPIYPVRGFL